MGNVLTGVSLLLAFLKSEQKRRDDAAKMHFQNQERLVGIETRLSLMYQWFQGHVINRPPSE